MAGIENRPEKPIKENRSKYWLHFGALCCISTTKTFVVISMLIKVLTMSAESKFKNIESLLNQFGKSIDSLATAVKELQEVHHLLSTYFITCKDFTCKTAVKPLKNTLNNSP